MKTIHLSLVVISLFLASQSRGGSLDAPGAQVVTVKTEIQRGMSAGLQPASAAKGILAFDAALRMIEGQNTQKGTLSHGFLLGMNYEVWLEYWRVISSGLLKGPELKLAALNADTAHLIFTRQKQMLDLTDDQVREVVGDYAGKSEDVVWARVYAAQAFTGTFPARPTASVGTVSAPMKPAPSYSAPAVTSAPPASRAAQEADAARGVKEGQRVGGNRFREGFPKPTLNYLDGVLKIAAPNESEAFKLGFKGGYLSVWADHGQ